MTRKYNFYCNYCGAAFTAARHDARTCSHNCRTHLLKAIRTEMEMNPNVEALPEPPIEETPETKPKKKKNGNAS